MRARIAILAVLSAGAFVRADFTRNILVTGYWPPTNNMVRKFSTNPEQNPGGWIGQDWEGRGYDVYSFFPEFPDGLGKGEGDLEVDYQDTSSDWWRITDMIDPVAIITFSRGSDGPLWEVEWRQRNLKQWINDYQAPYQPTPSPPDPGMPDNAVRYSTLPMQDIVDAVDDAGLGLDAFIDTEGFGGRFLSEFIAYHGTWYQGIHADPDDAAWTVAAGHVHVGIGVGDDVGELATFETLRVLTDYLDSVLPAPTALAPLGALACMAARRRRM